MLYYGVEGGEGNECWSFYRFSQSIIKGLIIVMMFYTLAQQFEITKDDLDIGKAMELRPPFLLVVLSKL